MASQHSNYIVLYDFFSFTFSSRNTEQRKQFSLNKCCCKRSLPQWMLRIMAFLFQEPQGQRRAVFQSSLCNKPSWNLMAQNNKHFIISNNFMGWMGSAGAICLFLMRLRGLPSPGTRLGWNIQVGALTWLATGCHPPAESSAVDRSTPVFPKPHSIRGVHRASPDSAWLY